MSNDYNNLRFCDPGRVSILCVDMDDIRELSSEHLRSIKVQLRQQESRKSWVLDDG